MTTRANLDHNATTPLRAEARAAMIAAMDVVGNPSSVHTEGRAAKRLVETSRNLVAEALGAGNADIVFTSGATEAAALILQGRKILGADVEHDAVHSWVDPVLSVDSLGQVSVEQPEISALQLANSETGVVQSLPSGLAVSDITQAFGKIPFAYSWAGVRSVFLSAHKFGGPKGVGALVVPQGFEVPAHLLGGGQEMGRRAGTENLIGIAGLAGAAVAAQADLASGRWERISGLRNILEDVIEAAELETIFVGKGSARLPNTANIIAPGWKGETQVMSMDLAGFAVSAGSACSSGKVKSSRVLRAMGFSDANSACALRVSLGLDTTEDEVLRFGEAWVNGYRKMRSRAA